ncbi:MAG: hypothetical protein KDE35_17085 [Geminicoccaceae bacterium]|nr:hypothetical protein [Geminicoccaceae bacterium]
MSASELRAALERLALTQSAAARRWGVDVRTMQRWCAGAREIPTTVAYLVRLEAGHGRRRCDELDGGEPA